MSAVSQVESVPSDEAVTGQSVRRLIGAGGRSAPHSDGRPHRRSVLSFTRAAFAGRLADANSALRRGDYATAYALARPLAEKGLAVAQLVLGVMRAGGHGAPRDDREATDWLRKAADQGRPEAQSLLGVMYASGRGVQQSDSKAIRWFREAAGQDYGAAQSNLGLMYAEGRGVKQDHAEAAEWFRKAADKGLTEAQAILGLMYVKGRGVPQNYILAHMWLNLAAAQGDSSAGASRDDLARMMTPAQIADAQQMALERRGAAAWPAGYSSR